MVRAHLEFFIGTVMEPQFWHERWHLNEIGFHQETVNAYLVEHWPSLMPEGENGMAFVPLCGKSLDMVWLRERGHEVLGVELSALAVEGFFQERDLAAAKTAEDGFDIYEAGGYRLLCGDFFAMRPSHLESVRAVYDRAALIALPAALQERYAAHLRASLPPACPIFLIALEYDPGEAEGPPFSTGEARIRELFGEAFDVVALGRRDALAENPGLRGRGLSWLVEAAYVLRRVAA